MDDHQHSTEPEPPAPTPIRPRRRRGSSLTLDDFNARYALVTVGTWKKDAVVAEFDAAGAVVGIWSHDAFRRRLSNVKMGKKQAADFFLAHVLARRYERLVYAPPGSPALPLQDSEYNTWRGLAVAPAAGDWSRTREFMHRILCAGDDAAFAWLFNWHAALVQRPGAHGHTAPLLVGGQGIGKGMYASQVIGAVFHDRDCAHIKDPKRVTATFNTLYSGRVFVYADEAVWSDAKAANQLKGLITEPTVIIEPKYLPPEEQRSTLHFVIASNAERPLPVEHDDRRFAVFQVDESRKGDIAYFQALQAALDGGERAAALHDLLQHSIDDALLRRPIETAAKARLKALSLSPLEHWWHDDLAAATPPSWSLRRGRQELCDAFHAWKHKYAPAARELTSTIDLGNFLATHFHRGGFHGWPHRGANLKVQTYDGRQNAWEFPDLVICRQVFTKATGVPGDWAAARKVLPYRHRRRSRQPDAVG